jgi:hypothetical protein
MLTHTWVEDSSLNAVLFVQDTLYAIFLDGNRIELQNM